MLEFEGKIKNAGSWEISLDTVKVEGFMNGKHCRITIEAPGIAEELPNLYGIDEKEVPIKIGNWDEF